MTSGINVIIPLGGLNSRFSANGYLLPAPLVRVAGKEIILWTLSNIRLTHDDELMIVYPPQFINKHLLEGIVRRLHPRAKFAYLKGRSRGPIETVRTGLKALPPNCLGRPTICMDGDGHFVLDITSLYRKVAAKGDGGILSYKDVQPKPLYSYVTFKGPDRHVRMIKEKEKISDWANTGTYCFPSGVQLLKYIDTALEAKKGVHKYAFYTSSVIQAMMKDNTCQFQMIQVKEDQFHSLGSPDLIKDFSKSQQKNFKRKRFCFDLENTLVTSPKVPGDYSTCTPIAANVKFVRALSNMGHTIIIQSTVSESDSANSTFHGVVQMLEDLGIPHDDVYLGKPKADFYIDDEAIYAGHDLSKELGFYDINDLEIKTPAQQTKPMHSPNSETKRNRLKTRVELASHMKRTTMGDEDVYINSHTGLPIFRVMKISTYFLFDLDGTMVATDPVYLKVFSEILSPFGYKVDKKFFEENVHGKVDQKIFESLCPKLSQIERKDLILKKDALFRKEIFSIGIEPMKGLLDFIDWAESYGIRSACVTNCPRNTAEALLSALDLRRRMDFVIIGAECTRAKPYPDPYQTAMSRLGARPEDCIIFEDSRSGIRSAVGSKARMVIGIRSSLVDHVLLQHGANASVADFTEVTPNFFNQLHSSQLSSNVENRVVIALREAGFPVKGISTARQLSGGNVALCNRMTVQYATTSEEALPFPKSMILKMEFSDSKNRIMNGLVNTLKLYDREWNFYSNVSSQVAIRVPRTYAVVTDGKKRKIGIIMEDLEDCAGASIPQTLTIPDAKAIASSLAQMHAQFWCRQPMGIMKANDPKLRGVADTLKARWGYFKARWEHQLLEEHISLGEIILPHLPWIQDQLSQPPFTLCHGDTSLSNCFFLQVLNRVPAFVDWQFCHMGKGIADLAHLVISSFPIQDQPAIENQLVEVYHHALKMNGIYGYSLKQCWADYRMSLMLLPFVESVWYGSLPQSELTNPEYPESLTVATFRAIHRHNAVSLLPEYFSMSLIQRCTRSLRKSGYPVENVVLDAKKLKGGYICETLRLTLEYEQGLDTSDAQKYPRSCVLKAEAPKSSEHQTALDLHLYDREWHFYKVISSLVPVRCPKMYAMVESNEKKGGIMGVLMEDLMIPGAVLCPKLDYDGIKILVNHTAKLHAKFWNDPNLSTLGLHALNGPWFQPAWEEKIAGHWPEFKTKWQCVLSKKQIAAGARIVKHFKKVQDHLASPPNTFLHGDVKPANMFMLKGNIPAFIDWQYTKIGKGVCDIVFFLIEGYPEAVQRELESKIRKYYWESLVEHGVKGYTLEMCKRDWAFACMYFPIYVCFWFGTVPDEFLVDEMFPRRIIPRTFDAIMRNNAPDLLPECLDNYTSRVFILDIRY